MPTATERLTFTPAQKVIGHIDVLPLGSVLRQETMFYQSTPEFVAEHGGPIAKEFIEKLPLTGNVLVDLRVHHLQRGHYPAIPGYHLDWLPRINKGQDVDLYNIPEYEHVILIAAESSLTEYVAEEFTVPEVPEHQTFGYVNEYIKAKGFKTEHVGNGDLLHFTSRDWHRPSPALGTEWRLLIRASKVLHRRAVNEIRTQSQVYIPFVEGSW